MATTPTRIYKVTVLSGDAQSEEKRLVRASHPAIALRHVAKDLITVEIASQEDLVALIAEKDVSVENAGEEAE